MGKFLSMTASGCDDPYEELANAIVLQVVADYRSALRRLAKTLKDRKAQQIKTECEEFFLSEWYHALTSVDGMMLLQRLRNGENGYGNR